jgi:hypothetical protein
MIIIYSEVRRQKSRVSLLRPFAVGSGVGFASLTKL